MTRFAEGTTVPVPKSRAEIERTLQRFGASHFGYLADPEKAVIAFRCKDRNIRFDMPLPRRKDVRSEEQLERRGRERWRALLLCIKAKLSSVESGIETFEEAFLSHVVMPDGRTVGEQVRDNVRLAYAEGRAVPLLPAPRGAP